MKICLQQILFFFNNFYIIDKIDSSIFFQLYSIEAKMHRKTNSTHTDFVSNSMWYSNYDSFKTTSYKNSIGSVQFNSSFNLKEPLYPVSTYKSKKSHTRNHSDLANPIEVKNQGNNKEGVGLNKTNIESLQKRIQKLQAKLNKTERALFEWAIEQNKKINDRICLIQSSQNKAQQKNEQIITKLTQIKDQIENTRYKKEINFSKYVSYSELNEISDILNEKLAHQLNSAAMQIMESMRGEVKTKINEVNEKVRKMISEQYFTGETQVLRSSRKYFGTPISFIYEEHVKSTFNMKSPLKQNLPMPSKNQSYLNGQGNSCINETIYYIDPEGYLLDKNSNYLMNDQMKQIKLSDKQLKILRKMNILASYN